MARSNAQKSIEARFDALCMAHNELIERFNKLEIRHENLAEMERLDADTLYKLVTKLKDYGYLSKPDMDTPQPLPQIRGSGCRLIHFRKTK